jgi:hypothetical protein
MYLHKILEPSANQIILADPTVISASDSPDGRFHLFCHSLLGIEEYVSNNAESWEYLRTVLFSNFYTNNSKTNLKDTGLRIFAIVKYLVKVIAFRKGIITNFLRPFVIKIANVYYLYFQEVTFTWQGLKFEFPPKSCIRCMQSEDLVNWSEPQTILEDDEKYSVISCPCLIKQDNKFRLFFTHDTELTGDNSMMEPMKVSYAESNFPNKEFKVVDDIVVYKDELPFRQIGALRAREIDGKYIYSCNPIEKVNGESKSSTWILDKQDDGKFVVKTLLANDDVCQSVNIKDVYVLDLFKSRGNIEFIVNTRRKVRFLDKMNLRTTIFSVLILVVKNVLLHREDLYMGTLFQEKGVE